MSVTSLPGALPDEPVFPIGVSEGNDDADQSGPRAPAETATARHVSRVPLYVAAFVVVVLSAGALFISGYTLGTQRSLTPGTTADQETLFAPYWEAYNKIAASYVGTFTPKSLVEGSIKGMFQALNDPFSSYMSSADYKGSLSGISGQFEGIGAEMAAVDSSDKTCAPLGPNCNLMVVRIIRNSPAQHAGLQPADIVTSIDGANLSGLALNDAVNKVRGQRNTQVLLSLNRAGKATNVAITRDVVETEEVTSTALAGGAITDLKIAGFSSSAAADFKKLLQQSLDAGVKHYVIDLRDDPGGYVDAALTIADQFVPSGPIYWEEDASGHDTAHVATGTGIATDPSISVAVLVNGGTASASEIVTGALKDTGRATVIGTRTYGKGTIQQWILLSNDTGGFRLSTAKWLTPDKTWIHGVGITPGQVVARPADIPINQDPQLDSALSVLLGQPASGGSAVAPSATPEPAASPAAGGPAGFVGPSPLAAVFGIG